MKKRLDRALMDSPRSLEEQVDPETYDAKQQFRSARRRAFLNDLVGFFRGRSNRLLSFHDVEKRLHLGPLQHIGIRDVPLAAIVGSVDRTGDFDRAFFPRQSHTEDRWVAVERRAQANVPMEPVELYKVGEVYFVKDGHHRVSVARKRGQKSIKANVSECKPRVNLTCKMHAEDLETVGALAEFLAQTSLDKTHPEADFRVSNPANYKALWKHILTHRYLLELSQGCNVSIEDAANGWYRHLYRPIIEVIRRYHILGAFPAHTEADLYLWSMSHRHHLARKLGQDISMVDAMTDFARHFSPFWASEQDVKETLGAEASDENFID